MIGIVETWAFEIGEMVTLRNVGRGEKRTVVGEIEQRYHAHAHNERLYKVRDIYGAGYVFAEIELRSARRWTPDDISFERNIFPYDRQAQKRTSSTKITVLHGVPGWDAKIQVVMRPSCGERKVDASDPNADVYLLFQASDSARVIRLHVGVQAAGFEDLAGEQIRWVYLDTLRLFDVIL